MSKRVYKPRTEAQKARRRELDRIRRENACKSNAKTAKTAKAKPVAKKVEVKKPSAKKPVKAVAAKGLKEKVALPKPVKKSSKKPTGKTQIVPEAICQLKAKSPLHILLLATLLMKWAVDMACKDNKVVIG